MSQAQYAIYRQKVLDLANTLVVKSSATANAINQSLQRAGYTVNDNDPLSWKYYQNLAGQYHPTDKPMTVTSLDTLQTIEFTRTNLQLHSATLREYQYGTEYYRSLVSQYPDQEMLILGILYPVEMSVSIDAEDGDILFYNPRLVEENETNLIPKLQQWTRSFMARWDIQAYSTVDMVYPAAQLWVMFANLPNEIENIRFLNTHTIYAHSFYIREFLASQGRLDRYFDALTTKQRLWLYRNIRYIHRHVGLESNFRTLMDRLLTDRGLPLAEWTMEHNSEDQLENIVPRIEFVRRNLNLDTVSAGRDTISIAQMLDKESTLARGNDENLVEVEASTRLKMENALQNRLKTKALESSILDLTDAYPYTRTDFLFNHWAYLAFNNRYNAYVTIDDPKSGNRLTLSMRNAFLAFLYSYNRSMSMELETLGALNCKMIRRRPTPPLSELRALCEERVVSTELLQRLYTGLYTMPSQYISTEGFNDGITEIFNDLMDQRTLWSSQHDYKTRGQLKTAALRMYGHYRVDLGGDTTYEDWMRDQGLALDDYNEEESGLLAAALLAAATGEQQNVTLSLKDIQGAMLRLMAQLSSYSIQFLQTINDSPIKVVDWGTVSPTQPDVRGLSESQWPIVVVRGLNNRGLGRRRTYIDVFDLGAGFKFNTRARGEGYWQPDLIWSQGARPVVRQSLLISKFELLSESLTNRQIEDVEDTETNFYVPPDRLPLEDAFMSLTSEHYQLTEDDRESLLDRWTQWDAENPIELPDPDYNIDNPYLDGHYDIEMTLDQPYLDGHRYLDPVDLGTIAIEGPLQPTYPTPVSFDVTLTPFPSFDGLASVVGGFNYHALQLDGHHGSIDMPVLQLLEELDGHDPQSIMLNPVMMGYMVMLGLHQKLEGHRYEAPSDPDTNP